MIKLFTLQNNTSIKIKWYELRLKEEVIFI
jgi:hypothetical protein